MPDPRAREDRTVVLAKLLSEQRLLCAPCLSAKSGLSIGDVIAVLKRIAETISVAERKTSPFGRRDSMVDETLIARGEPLDRVRHFEHPFAEARPERLVHQRANIRARQWPGRGGPGEHLAVVTV